MYGQLNISMVVSLNSAYSDTKRVRLASYHCERTECDNKLSQFAEANPLLWSTMRGYICAEWVARECVL